MKDISKALWTAEESNERRGEEWKGKIMEDGKEVAAKERKE